MYIISWEEVSLVRIAITLHKVLLNVILPFLLRVQNFTSVLSLINIIAYFIKVNSSRLLSSHVYNNHVYRIR